MHDRKMLILECVRNHLAMLKIIIFPCSDLGIRPTLSRQTPNLHKCNGPYFEIRY